MFYVKFVHYAKRRYDIDKCLVFMTFYLRLRLAS